MPLAYLCGMRSTGDSPGAAERELGPLVGEGGGEQVPGADVHAHAHHERGRRAAAQRCVQLAAARER